MLIISGAYGRDYKSKKAVLADWVADKDFTVRSIQHGSGRRVNKADAENFGVTVVEARYKADTGLALLERVGGGWVVK